jgi:uncharacterized cupin superfamily protein
MSQDKDKLADQPHPPEAPLTRDEHGLRPTGDGWYVLNVADCRWSRSEAFGAYTDLEGEQSWGQVGLNIHVLEPGKPSCMYHRERDQEGFLVLSGECLLLIDGGERQLKAWDYVHCPPGTDHVFVGGAAPCAVLMLGARQTPGVHYPVNALAQKHGAGVATATDSPKEAYAEVEPPQPCAAQWPPSA